MIKNAAAKWNYSRFTFRFSADDCPSTRPDNCIEFGVLDDPNITAENSHLNEGTSTRMNKCAIWFNTAKKWNVSNDMPTQGAMYINEACTLTR
ncbi:hypothetical protein V1281_003310 [Nitrobacteraceae bacterium AZCC 2161]